MKVIVLSGKSGSGKDTIANIMLECLESKGKSVIITHFADPLKYVCEQFFGWDGEKDDAGRTLLQYVGTDCIREYNRDFWIDFIDTIITAFSKEWDYVIIADARFKNEVDTMKRNHNAIHIHIDRPDYDNGLTESQKNHLSETDIDDLIPDYTLINEGDMDWTREYVEKFLEGVMA